LYGNRYTSKRGNTNGENNKRISVKRMGNDNVFIVYLPRNDDPKA
jgi:hypothetical protein